MLWTWRIGWWWATFRLLHIQQHDRESGSQTISISRVRLTSSLSLVRGDCCWSRDTKVASSSAGTHVRAVEKLRRARSGKRQATKKHDTSPLLSTRATGNNLEGPRIQVVAKGYVARPDVLGFLGVSRASVAKVGGCYGVCCRWQKLEKKDNRDSDGDVGGRR